MGIYIPPQGDITINESAIKNTDAEIRDGVWADSTKAHGANVSYIYANTSTLIKNTSLILVMGSNDATLANQSTILQYNQTIDAVADGIKAITDVLPNLGNLTSIGTLLNQSLILTDGNNLLANTSLVIGSNATIDTIVDLNLANTSTLIQYNNTIDAMVDFNLANSSTIIGQNATIGSVVDNVIANTSTIINNISSGEIGDASVANQSLILTDGDLVIANTSTILNNLSSGEIGDATIANQSLVLVDGDNILVNTSSLLTSNATIDTVVDAIQAVTGVLPDSGALTSLGTLANQTLILVDGDNLLANTTSLMNSNSTIDTVVDTILTNTSTLLSNTTEVSGFYNLSASGGPHTVFTIGITERKRLNSLFLDLINLSYRNNIHIDHKIDGTNYRTFVNMTWATTDDDGMYFNKNLAFSHDVRLTMSNGTSANATVPYSYILESME